MVESLNLDQNNSSLAPTPIHQRTRVSNMFKSLGFLCLLTLASQIYAKDCAMVLMHGKWAYPPPGKSLKEFSEVVGQACKIFTPNMPWSGSRNYDQTYENALNEISKEVQSLRNTGYKRVIIAGQSFGANGAMAYQAYIGDADAVIALAPGHVPSAFYDNGFTRSQVNKARDLVKQGKPEEIISFTDINQGRRKSLEVRADIFLSFFDPNGLANMSQSASSFKQSVPFLWVIGRQDRLYPDGSAYAFDKAPKHPKSNYLLIDAGHMDTSLKAAHEVLEWIRQLD